MYVQITQKCNMKCDHCCYECDERGEDMTFRTFKKAVELCGETTVIGGGEPTLHRQFHKFLLYAMSKVEYVWLATNGSITDTALMLAELSKRGLIGVALSQDSFHDPIDDRVVKAFQNIKRSHYEESRDRREIRNTEHNLIAAGRALKIYGVAANAKMSCCEEGGLIRPDGSIWWCGCKDSISIGHVRSGVEPKWQDALCDYGCYQKWLHASPKYLPPINHIDITIEVKA